MVTFGQAYVALEVYENSGRNGGENGAYRLHTITKKVSRKGVQCVGKPRYITWH